MTVEAVVGDVQLSAEIPLRVGKLPLQQVRERLEPGDPLAPLALPEFLERNVVDVRLRVCPVGELLRRRIATLFGQQRLDRLIGHADMSSS